MHSNSHEHKFVLMAVACFINGVYLGFTGLLEIVTRSISEF